MDSPNILDLNILFAGLPLVLSVGPESYRFRTRWNVGRHCNADFEVHILLSGSCVVEIDGQEILVPSGNAVLIPPGAYHCLHQISEDFEWLCFSFNSPQKRFSQNLLAQIDTAVSGKLSLVTLVICRMILDELNTTHAFKEDSLKALFSQLLVEIFRGAGLEFSQQPNTIDTSIWRTTIIDDFFAPLSNCFGTENELASCLNLSRRQLNRVLQQKYGMGFRQKMLQTRMEYAGNLLRTTNHPAGIIGSMVGYATETSFYKAFQSYYHMAPQQYRKLQKDKK